MESRLKPTSPEPFDGDWCLVDLTAPITEEATRYAHALGMDFSAFMIIALEERLSVLRHEIKGIKEGTNFD